MIKAISSFFKNIINKPGTIMNFWVSILVISMITMVVLVTVNSFRITQECSKYREQIHENLNSEADSVIISRSDLEGLLESKQIESNDYLAIILTLITLCVSLSAAIPYIVGKSVTSNQVKDTVEELYRRQKDENDKNIRKTLGKLEAAEAHLSRMVAYNLMYALRDKAFMKSTSVINDYDPIHHPFWALGWASKALIRYVKVAQSESLNTYAIERFCSNCIKYIIDASDAIAVIANVAVKTSSHGKSQTTLCDGKVLRAYVDLFDALGFYKSLRYNGKIGVLMVSKEEQQLNEALQKLYRILTPSAVGSYDENIVQEIAKKSKYDQYLKDSDGSPASYSILKKYIENWCSQKQFSNTWY